MTALDFQSNIGLVHVVARKCYGWTKALGISLDYDDVFQEVSLAYVTAQRGYNPDLGIKFSAYLTRAALNQVRKTIGAMTGLKRLNDKDREALRRIKEENEHAVACGEKTVPSYMGLSVVYIEDLGSDEMENPLDMFASQDATPEEKVIAEKEWEYVRKNLSPLAQMMADMLSNPPKLLLDEIEAQNAYLDLALEKGEIRRARRPSLSLKSIAEFIHLGGSVRREKLLLAENELLKAVAAI